MSENGCSHQGADACSDCLIPLIPLSTMEKRYGAVKCWCSDRYAEWKENEDFLQMMRTLQTEGFFDDN